MKNLYQYSAEERPIEFLYKGIFNKHVIKEQNGSLPFTKEDGEKNDLRSEVEKQLLELNAELTTEKVDTKKVLAIFDEGGTTEKYVERKNGTRILKDKSNKSKIKLTDEGILKVKDKDGKRDILKVDTKEEKVLRNEQFVLEKKEVTPETDASKEFKKKIENLDGNIEGMLEDDLVSLEGKIKDLRVEIKDTDNGLTDKERTYLLGRLDSLIARIAERREDLKDVVVENPTMKEYERKISGFESRLSGAEGETLGDLLLDAQALRTEINDDEEKELSDEEKKTLTARIDSLIKNIEKKQDNLDSVEKREAAKQSLADAQKLIDAIDITTLNITNCKDFSKPIEDARKAIWKADGLTKKNFPDLAKKIPGLDAQLDKKENQVELYKTGADKQKEVTDVYKKKTDKKLNEIEAGIKEKVKAHKDILDGIENKTPSKLPVEPLTINPSENPITYEQIQEGMEAHRLDSLKMMEEVNFLQECGSTFATEIAEFEAKKSEFNLPNIGRSIIASVAILPGAAWDLGEWALGTGKRAGDRFGWLGFGDSRAEELQKKQGTFETEFTAKQLEIKTKKSTLDKYGETLQKNSGILKDTAPAKVKTDIQESISKQLSDKELDVNDEPWNEIYGKLTKEFEKTADEKVKPAVNQLDAMVDGSVSELTDASDFSLEAADQTSKYIKDLDIHSATVLDMSVGFITKNIAKGLDGVGDVLAMNPITGVLGGVCRAAGGLVEGVGTLVTDPLKVAEGFGTLFNVFSKEGREKAGDSWVNLGSALMGGKAWKEATEAWEAGNIWKALSEGSAAVGEAGGNIASFVFTGGTVGAVRGGGIMGRMANMSSKIGKVARSVGAKIPASVSLKAISLGRKLSKVGRPLGVAGDYALLPLRWGMKPLRAFGGKGKNLEKVLNKGLSPSRWAKIKPGSNAALTKSNRLMKDVAKHREKLAKLRQKRATAVGRERNLLSREITKYEGKITTAVTEARQLRIGTSAAMTRATKLQADITRWNDELVALTTGGPLLPPAIIAQQTAILNGKISRGIVEMARITSLPMPAIAATGWASKGKVAAAMVGTGVVYAGVATAKNNARNKVDNIKNDIPKGTEFEPTPLADLKSPAESGDGEPGAGVEQTLPYAIADKQLFEGERKNQLESFFKTNNKTNEKTIKSDILEYSAKDLEVVIDGVEGKTLTNLWEVKKSGKAVAFTLDSKMGQNKIPSLTKIEIRTT